MHRFLCIHAHFSQPPRENPWLETIEVEDAAEPYHDWNERVCAEAYAPNAVARILNEAGQVVELVNNYAQISFSFEPILLRWLEKQAPDVYRAVIQADRESRTRFSGHGSAIAQPYAHPILPLSSRRDKTTLVRWGLADFAQRFDRPAEGIWLPETAVDIETLEVLAEEGLKFTILAMNQAARICRKGQSEWTSAAGHLDSLRPYRCTLPSGRAITLFFYHDDLTQVISSGEVLHNGEIFAERLLRGFPEDASEDLLLHVATDGELYGHRHRHGDMALAYALHRLSGVPRVRFTNYAEYLSDHPPQDEVQICEPSSSWGQGLERWCSSGGGNAGRGPGWHQHWRAPLRETLNWLAAEIDSEYSQAAATLVADPWEARNDYFLASIDRSAEAWGQFLGRHARPGISAEESFLLRRWLEAERHRLIMFASFGWHFDDIADAETVYNLLHAARAVQLADGLLNSKRLETGLLQRLAEIPGNRAEYPTGQVVYEQLIRPQTVTWSKVAANFAILALFERLESATVMEAYEVIPQEVQVYEAGKIRAIRGWALFRSQATGETAQYCFIAVHFGDHNVTCGVRPYRSEVDYLELSQRFAEAFARVDTPELVRLLDREFGPESYSLGSLFRDQQRKVLKQVSRSQLAEAASAYARVFEQQLPLVKFLKSIGEPPPRAFSAAAAAMFNTDLAWALADDDPDWSTIERLFRDAREYNASLETEGLGYKFATLLARLANRWQSEPTSRELLESLLIGVRLARRLPFDVSVWRPQNVYVSVLQTLLPEILRRAVADTSARRWLDHFVELGKELRVDVGHLTQERDAMQALPTVEDLVREVAASRHLPTATYRFQLHAGFTFQKVTELLPYLAELGISDLYLSPILMARPGSLHGYDVTDHSRINPELGSDTDYDALAEAAQQAGLGIILDVVPNHMCVSHISNQWWMDVLENGVSSRFARYFDIDWYPVNPSLNEKVLLPILGDQYGQILESGQIRLLTEDGRFYFDYWQTRVPLAPRTTSMILEHRLPELIRRLGPQHADVLELQSILTALHYLPARSEMSPEQVQERYREKEVIRRRLRQLLESSGEVRNAVEASIREINGQPGKPETFDLLDQLVEAQSYRPAFWQVSTEEINYRRFFDVNELAAIRVEDPDVFRETHHRIIRLLAAGKAHGLRIDHPDGLKDPTRYFRRLQEEYVTARVLYQLRLPENGEAADAVREAVARAALGTPLFVIAEKILSEAEPLPTEWAVAGTTGYDFLNAVNSLFVAGHHREQFDRIYHDFLGREVDYQELIYNCKNLIMRISMASEINSLSHRLDRISERNRRYRDFTLNALRHTIREVIASLSVYRTYIVPGEPISTRDRCFVEQAVADANRRNPQLSDALFDFVRDTILLENLETFREPDRPAVIEWAARFQQLTGPIMAKGVEDTAFYVFNRFVALNEVGGHPDVFGIAVDEFHRFHQARARVWPHTMSAGSTHDTKRSEDVRARLNVLSEMPEEWAAAVRRWRAANAGKVRRVDDQPAPDPNDEYLLYQTLVGTWPTNIRNDEFTCYRQRICDYMLKAVKESKFRTSWINPNTEYDTAIHRFVHEILPDDPNDPFRADVTRFVQRIELFGYRNSIAQMTLRLTCPGIPDLYQGTECWDFSLVDPDNRRPVDFAFRQQLLAQLGECRHWPASLADPAAKLLCIRQLLHLRRQYPDLFLNGQYLPLPVSGPASDYLCAFARVQGELETGLILLVIVPRLTYTLSGGDPARLADPAVWGDTAIELPPALANRSFQELFTGDLATGPILLAGTCLADRPAAVFLSIPPAPPPTSPESSEAPGELSVVLA
jgi:(1->4)-alpha-D-glucan 1-alpha-D-glucosylmutase